jgi:hypothetical protein
VSYYVNQNSNRHDGRGVVITVMNSQKVELMIRTMNESKT